MKLAILAGVGAVCGFVLGLVVLAGGVGGSSASSAVTDTIVKALQQSMCQSARPLSGLTAPQSANAETIVSVSDTLSGENPQAAEIALMAGFTESGLSNPAGGMGGAIGLFQQTSPGWGTPAQLHDPAYAAGAFVKALLVVSAWQQLPPWLVAQDVQRSGAGQPGSPLNPYPGQVGGNYEAKWAAAQRVYGLVTGADTAMDCGGGPAGGEPGPPSRHGLPVGYTVPDGTTPRAALAINYATSKLGDAYVWGAAGPNQFDCSGLTMMAWQAADVSLVHYTVTQDQEGRHVPASQIVPGDLVLVPGSDPPGPGLPGHVGMYIGDSLVVSAIDTQQGVAVQTWATFVSGGLDAVVDPTQAPA
jgi:peptidoglycan DL-endopeptidase CwlO